MIVESGKTVNSVSELENNAIIGELPSADNATIKFSGKNNILVVEENVRLEGSINLNGSNTVIYLSSNPTHVYRLKLDVWNNSAVYFGKDSYFNGALQITLSEGRHLIVGNDGVFSFGIWVRTADPHIIYDVKTKNRVNLSKNVMIGDHVWLGQNSLLLKGSKIGSGSIVAANCVITGKEVESNAIYGGNPGKCIKSGIFFSGESVHAYQKKQTKKSMTLDTDKWSYCEDSTTLNTDEVFRRLDDCKDSNERLEIVKELAAAHDQKNRFAIEVQEKTFFERLKSR